LQDVEIAAEADVSTTAPSYDGETSRDETAAQLLNEADPASRLRPVLAVEPAARPLRAGGRLSRTPLSHQSKGDIDGSCLHF
jgi:hypothetical protein